MSGGADYDEENAAYMSITIDQFMVRSFFIYDRTAGQKEEDPPEEMIVYFYPPEVELQKQLLLIGSCSSMVNFAKNFTKSLPKILAMEKEKLALKEVGDLTLVLTGSLNQPDSALYLDLEKIYGAFKFLYGSFDIIKRNIGGDRLKFLDVMKELGKEIIPFVRQYENENHPSFDKLPFSHLPAGYNRYFLTASEILNSMKTEPDNLGGCVFHSGNVLCTHLEPSTSSYILTKLESMTKNQISLGNGDICIPVFMNSDELEKLRDGKPPTIELKEDLKSQLPESYFTKSDPSGEFVGLYILFLSKIAIAVLMNLPAMYDERHINKTRLLAQSRIHALDVKLNKLPKNPESQNPGFNYLTYDKVTKNITGSSLEMTSDLDIKFHIATRIEHEIFSSNPKVYFIMLREHSGVVLGKRVFDNEVYFQYRTVPIPTGSSTKAPILNKDISRLEEAARDSLQDLSISLF